MDNWTLDRLPSDFVRFIQSGIEELGDRLAVEPELKRQIEDVIREQLSRSPQEALEVENGLALLVGRHVAESLTACLRYLEEPEEIDDLGKVGFEPCAVAFIRYLTARYGPVLKAIRRRHNHPYGWQKCGHMVQKLENGTTHVHMKIVRNDDQTLVIEDDADSMLRLINLMLKALEHADDYHTLDPHTVQEFSKQYSRVIEQAQEHGALGSNRTEH